MLLHRLVHRVLGIHPGDPDDRNAWFLVLEMFWASILGAIATFNAAYAIRLGADNLQVSLLSSIPALMAVLVSVPAGQFLQRKPRRKPWVLGSLFAYRVGFLLVALAPWIQLGGLQPGLAVVMILSVMSAPAHFFNVGWLPMLAEVIPEERRATLFAARNIINQATISVTVFMCGQWLNTVVFPINYQAMYAFGFVTSLLSMVFLMRLRIPDSPDEGDDLPGEKPRGLRDAARQMRVGLQSTGERMRAKPAFLRITVNTFLHGVGVWMAAPLYALYFVRELNASDAWLGLNGTIASVGTIVGYSLWRSLLVRWGEPVSLKRTIVLIGVYPVLVGLTPSLAVILLYGALNGLVAPGVNLAHFNLLLKATPANARPRFTALYMTIMNIGAFFSPILAVALADQIGLAPMLIIAGLLSVIGSTSFWWNPVLREEPETAPALASGE